MKNLFFLCLLLGTFFICRAGSEPLKGWKFYQTNEFSELYSNNFYQIKAGNLALKKAKDGGVKAFGSQMAADYANLNEQLKKLPSQPSSADSTQVILNQQLLSSSGTNFDSRYINLMIKKVKETLTLYQKASTSNNGDLKQFATKNLPMIRGHLSSVKALAKQLNIQAP